VFGLALSSSAAQRMTQQLNQYQWFPGVVK